jgi:enoyl-[acyl-carrier protein] reductase II
MIWCSGWELASSVSNAGCLGLIGSGSMYPDILQQHIRKCKKATSKPFGVNIPLLYPQVDDHIDIIIREGVNIVFTSAGNPKKYTQHLKEHGITVVHVVANKKFALKAVDAGVDAIVAEGFEAGGHNGFEETTSLVLIPIIKEAIKIPLIAAGGIATGKAMYAAMSLGADGVQIGSRFVATVESSAHQNFKRAVIDAEEGATKLVLKKLVPVRLIKNKFFEMVEEAEQSGASKNDLIKLLGRGRAKSGMYEGDIQNGELEIGQVSGMINSISSVNQVIEEIIREFNQVSSKMSGIKL